MPGSEWLVTTCHTDSAYSAGPSVIVDADDAQEAAEAGIAALRTEDGGYGFVCRECEGVVVPAVTVFRMSAGEVFQVVQKPVAGDVE